MGSCQIDPQEESQVSEMKSRQRTKNILSHRALLKVKAPHWLFCNATSKTDPGLGLDSYLYSKIYRIS